MHESLHTLFFAQGIGLYLIIIAIIMLTRAAYYQEMLTHLKVGSATIVVAATMGLIIGILMVLVHNIWIWESDVLITIIAWLLVIKSVMWLAFPECMVKYTEKVYSGRGYYLVAIIAAIIGIILLAHGFYLYGLA
ncbi:Integral membrane protein (PIN domain superfamily) [Legionella quateirensis]|uniref:Integral membrane protein (PIN domain superfamily) n=2 Tax=Legionella quateirensis TaxID=45072 RepID=A0A378KVX6_9GAMM|nr:Integral membrane protein (PIN domain superfamily) [Legionella quateirensis]STY18994.1 Integral membrane protein (PIN domain superfamily) [Legionella quateirensis]